MEVTCVGIAAVLKSKGLNPFDVEWLPIQWRLSYHPLWSVAMQRMCPSSTQLDLSEQAESSQLQPSQQGHSVAKIDTSRFLKVKNIPTPTTSSLRRASMNDAFNTLRDDFECAECPEKYRAVMASIFDLRAYFRGTPGVWLQEPPKPSVACAVWKGDALAPAPCNLAAPHRKQQSKFSTTPSSLKPADMTVRQEKKKRKRGELPSVEDRRKAAGDWSLYWPTGNRATFMCPVPGCMQKPIKNNDQAKYHHRATLRHKKSLERHPYPPHEGPDISGTHTGIPGDENVTADLRGTSDAENDPPPGIPANSSGDSMPITLSDSYRNEVHEMAQQMEDLMDSKPLSRSKKTAIFGQAAIDVSARRAAAKAALRVELSRQVGSFSKAPASVVALKQEMVGSESSNATLQSECGMKGIFFRTSHNRAELRAFLEEHAAFYARLRLFEDASPELPEKLFIVECGLNGDCFFHSLSWLCRRSIAGHEIPTFIEESTSLAELHVPMRRLILSHLQQCARSIFLNAEEFGTLDLTTPTLEQWLITFEETSVDEYVRTHSTLHQFSGYPELVAWTSWSRRPLVLIVQTSTVSVISLVPYSSNDQTTVMVNRGSWEDAALHLEQGSFCLLQRDHHYMAIVPWHRLSPSCPQPSSSKKAWADFISRPITLKDQGELQKFMPIVDVHTCQATRHNQ